MLNRGLKALLFNFKELPLWNVATADEPTQDLLQIEVELNGTEPEATNLTLVPSLFLAIEPPDDITVAFNLHLQVALEWLQQTSPKISASISQHNMPGRKLPSVTLGVLPSTRAGDSLGLERVDSAIPDQMATSSQASPCVVTSENISSITQVGQSPSLATVLRTLEVASISSTPQSQILPKTDPAYLADEVLQLQGEMNVALEWLFTTKATMDSYQKELVLTTTITMHQKEAQATEAITEVKMHCREAKSAVQPQSRRQRPIMLSKPVPWNNPTRKACQAWSVR